MSEAVDSLRGGSRVVQVQNLRLLFLRFLIAVQEINEFDEFLSFVDISENNVIRPEKICTQGVGLDGSFHKSLKTLFYWPETLTLFTNYSNLVVIGYPESQTTAETFRGNYSR